MSLRAHIQSELVGRFEIVIALEGRSEETSQTWIRISTDNIVSVILRGVTEEACVGLMGFIEKEIELASEKFPGVIFRTAVREWEKQLINASKFNRLEEIESLLRDHPNIRVNWSNPEQQTALHVASSEGHFAVVKTFLAHPAVNINMQTRNGATPLLCACVNGNVAVVSSLLKDPGVDITLSDRNGCTPLWWASCHGHFEVNEWFIASGRHLEIAKNVEKPEVVSLLERFAANPAQTVGQIREKLNFVSVFTYFIIIMKIFILFSC